MLTYEYMRNKRSRYLIDEMEQFQNTDRLKILLSHILEGLLLWRSMEHRDDDFVGGAWQFKRDTEGE